MSQSATFYRISEEVFEQLERSHNRNELDLSSIAKDYAIASGSFMAIEFILAKGQDEETAEIAKKIFYPKHKLGENEIDNLSIEEQLEFYESGSLIPYLDAKVVSKINEILDRNSPSDIHAKYDSKELNDNGIYPNIWHDDNSTDKVFNKNHILEDLMQLKYLFKEAVENKDYILVFVG